ncbi:hypothetical protein F5Y19DRAFT_296267 [Xylariaceae sp. FL1651]|nr:hypothetical protein F5Y19DRAFT_296267 [Xylariaceae sp. FL1651]
MAGSKSSRVVLVLLVALLVSYVGVLFYFPSIPRPPNLTLYDILNITTNATDSDIKHAYRMQARRCHPDKVKLADAAAATVKLRSVQAASEFLLSEKRCDYDYNVMGTDAGQLVACKEKVYKQKRQEARAYADKLKRQEAKAYAEKLKRQAEEDIYAEQILEEQEWKHALVEVTKLTWRAIALVFGAGFFCSIYTVECILLFVYKAVSYIIGFR